MGAPDAADAGDLGLRSWFEYWGTPSESLTSSTIFSHIFHHHRQSTLWGPEKKRQLVWGWKERAPSGTTRWGSRWGRGSGL